MNVIVRLELEHAYNDVVVQHFNHNFTGTSREFYNYLGG